MPIPSWLALGGAGGAPQERASGRWGCLGGAGRLQPRSGSESAYSRSDLQSPPLACQRWCLASRRIARLNHANFVVEGPWV